MTSVENLSIIAVGGVDPTAKASAILSEAVDLTGKEDGGNTLVIPTARPTHEAHQSSVAKATELFGKRLGLPVEVLHDFNSMPAGHVVDELLEWADLVYISGGDTKKMMEVWQKYGVDAKLCVRAMGGLVLTGISAGAIAPFKWGHSDWEHYHVEGDDWDFRRVDGLGLIAAAVTPHNNKVIRDVSREEHFLRMFEQNDDTNVGFGIDNYAGLKIHDGRLTLRSAAEGAGATLLDRRSGKNITVSRLDTNQLIALGELGLSD